MAYVRLDKIKGSAHMESIVASADLVNGQFVALGALEADGEARAVTPMANQATEKIAFHASVPLTYKDGEDELDFVLEAGKIGRAIVLEDGDIISISEDGVTGVVAVDAIVNPTAKGFAVGESADTIHGEIIAIENDMIAGKLVVIRISR